MLFCDSSFTFKHFVLVLIRQPLIVFLGQSIEIYEVPIRCVGSIKRDGTYDFVQYLRRKINRS